MDEQQRKQLFQVFDVYDNSLIHWERVRVAFGEDTKELKKARELINEARAELIRVIIKSSGANPVPK
jgi:hypothetical protein